MLYDKDKPMTVIRIKADKLLSRNVDVGTSGKEADDKSKDKAATMTSCRQASARAERNKASC